jgi:4-amino-4-deoxy-L-arabinose transferase-like glycosyltransferase
MNFRTLLIVTKKHGLSILALMGGLIYAYQVLFYAITTLPNMDEGAFLLKGLAYITGKYTYYQEYGFWNTKMFFSYYLWGIIQALFGAGIWAPRIVSILFNLSTALAIWKIARKASPAWLAPLALWIMALNTPFIKILSRANSQVVVNVLIVWIVYIFIKKNIRTPLVIIGSILVGALVLTRENMVFFVFPWLFFLWWDQGKKTLILGLLTFLTVVGVGHALFFPEIMGLWLRFLPSNWVNDPVISLLSTPYNLDLQVPFFSKLVSLSYGIRHYYVQVFGFVVSLFYIKQREGKTIDSHLFKVKIFLSSSFLFLLPFVFQLTWRFLSTSPLFFFCFPLANGQKGFQP